jgi:lysozyme
MIERLKEMLIRHEGKRNKIYKCPAGFNTIGIGHNIDAKGLPGNMREYLKHNERITDAMINQLFAEDISDAINDCTKLYPAFNTFTESRKIALIDFIFQLGPGGAGNFRTTNRHINAGAWQAAGLAMFDSKWFRQTPNRAKEIISMIVEG